MAYKQHKMLDWPTASAHILRFHNGVHEDDREYKWYVNPSVEYEYQVNGQIYRTEGLNPSPFNYQDPVEFERDLGHVRPGGSTKCWYNPRNPRKAYLVNSGITAGPRRTMLAGGALFLLLGAASLAYKFRGRRF